MKVKPFRSSKKTKVYHNNNKCTEGDNIQPENKIYGDGDYELCKRCFDLNGGKK